MFDQMTSEWIHMLVLSIFIALTKGERVCTFVHEAETAGSHYDWYGFKTMANTERCKDFCSSVPECTAAEFSYSSYSCYLFDGPTTLHYNKDHVFMARKCKEITTPRTTTTEDITPSTTTILISTLSSTTEVTTSSTVTDPSLNFEDEITTTFPTPKATESVSITSPTTILPRTEVQTSEDKDNPVPSYHLGHEDNFVPPSNVGGANISKDKTDGPSSSEEIRTKRSASTEPITATISKILTTETIRTTKRKRKRPMMPAAKLRMLHESSNNARVVTNDITTEYTTPSKATTSETPTTRRTPSSGVKTRKLFPFKPSRNTLDSLKPDTSLTRSTMIPFTTPLPTIKPTRLDSNPTVRSLDIMDVKKGLTLTNDPSGESKPMKLVALMTTKIYKPATHGTLRSRSINRVEGPTAHPRYPGMSMNGRLCRSLCIPMSRYWVFNPRVKMDPSALRPQYQSQEPGTGRNPVRFRTRMRLRLPMFLRIPYRYQLPYVYRRPAFPYRYGPFPPQHAAVARYGQQSNPWANNVKRASLKTPKTHQVSVIPGGRYKLVANTRRAQKQPYRYKQQEKPTQKPIAIKKPDPDTEVNDQAKQRPLERGYRTSSKSRSTVETSTPKNDLQWQLKSHYNTYTLRLGLPLPISGYKKCYLRQELPPPPAILTVSFRSDGSFTAKALPATYPKRVCVFVTPGMVPELHLPSPLVIFTGTSFVKDSKELNKIYRATVPKAKYDAKSLQQRTGVYTYTPPIFRQIKIPISFARAMVSFDVSRMGFIYRFTVRLPRALTSRNIMVHESIPSNIPFQKAGSKSFMPRT